ncbi:MAG TPA: GYF domain-containing protein [Polyangiaceae bacterium]|nr:GYF domain-containing protein [Polyangiaceae bacterium]
MTSGALAASRVPSTGPTATLANEPNVQQQEVAAPDVATRGAAAIALTPSEDRPSPMAVPSAKAARKPSNRALHRTIIGVAAPAGASDIEVPAAERGSVRVPSLRLVPEREAPKPVVPRAAGKAGGADLKRTIIGGLEAPHKIDAPNQAVGLGVPVEPKWTVLIAKQGPMEMSGPEIVRAFALGKLTREANVWREGMSGWQPLAEVASLQPLFQRAGLAIEPPQVLTLPDEVAERAPELPDPQAGRASFSQEQPTVPRAPSLRPATPLAPPNASVDSAPPIPPEKAPAAARDRFDPKEDEITRIAPSPWQVADAGAKVTARLAVNAGLPPRQNSVPPMRHDEAQEPLDRLSKRPDLGPRDTVRGQVAAASSPPTTPPSSAPPTAREPIARQKDSAAATAAQSRAADLALSLQGGSEHPSLPSADLNTLPWQPEAATEVMTRNASVPAGKKPKRLIARWWFWAALTALIIGALVASYRTKQPRVAYAYLHRHGLDVPIDRTARGLHNVTQKYVVRPYRATMQRFRGKAQR